jgi:hypothetical protein
MINKYLFWIFVPWVAPLFVLMMVRRASNEGMVGADALMYMLVLIASVLVAAACSITAVIMMLTRRRWRD